MATIVAGTLHASASWVKSLILPGTGIKRQADTDTQGEESTVAEAGACCAES